MARYAIDKAIVGGDRPLGYEYRAEPEAGERRAGVAGCRSHGVEENKAAYESFVNGEKGSPAAYPAEPDEWFKTFRFGVRMSAFGGPLVETGMWLPASRPVLPGQIQLLGRCFPTGFPYRPEGDGLYRLRVKAGAEDQRRSSARPIMTINVFKKLLADVDVTASADDPQMVRVRLRGTGSEEDALSPARLAVRKNAGHRHRDQQQLREPGGKERPGHSWKASRRRSSCPRLFIDAVELEYNYHASWPPESHSAHPLRFGELRATRKPTPSRSLTRFMERAFRRPLREGELERKLELFRDPPTRGYGEFPLRDQRAAGGHV